MFTLGISTFDDYDGLYFTVTVNRHLHPWISEIVIIDNNPDSAHGKLNKQLAEQQSTKGCPIKYIPFTEYSSTAVRNEIFKYATRDFTVVVDSHVVLCEGAIDALWTYYSKTGTALDFVQGPLLYDNFEDCATHLEPTWRSKFYGTWECDRDFLRRSDSFKTIEMQGLGAFSCKTDKWVGINPAFRGFGGEEGYLQEKFRKAGGKCICLKDFKWIHRFNRVAGVPYVNNIEDRLTNYFLGWLELNKPVESIISHFTSEGVTPETIQTCYEKAAVLNKIPLIKAEAAKDFKAIVANLA